MSTIYTHTIPAPFIPVCLMQPGVPASVTLTDTFTHELLLAYCTIWGHLIGRTMLARKQGTESHYLVYDRTDAPRITRAHYPYSTLTVGGPPIRIPIACEPNLQALRTWTSYQGTRLKRKFSIGTDKGADEYLITRKA